MQKLGICLFLLLLCFPLIHGRSLESRGGTADGSEQWGYVEVRPKAHMFWWLYRSPERVKNGSSPWPTVLWLQGGPGASGVGIGNFQEIGPLDTDLKPRNWTWLQKADLLFVDNPVGAGFSYVEDDQSFVKTDKEAAADLTTLLKSLYNGNTKLQNGPLFVVGESYGGKYAVTLALSIVKAIKTGDLAINFGGIALGDSWISPEDFAFSMGPLLRDVSRLDINGEAKLNSFAEQIKKQIADGQYAEATKSWSQFADEFIKYSNSVSFYNFLLDAGTGTTASTEGSLENLMNGVIREKLKIIPKNVSWGEQEDEVFNSLASDFMRPMINEVDELLYMGINVTIYNGQLDLVCATKGVEAWVQKLKWEGLQDFNNAGRKPIYCGNSNITGGFVKSYKNLHFYWILEAGHYVPKDQPCMSLRMVSDVTQSPA